MELTQVDKLRELHAAGRGQDMQAVIDAVPYARFLGLELEDCTGELVCTRLPFAEHLIGNVTLPALHGGAVGALLEMTAVLQLLHDTACAQFPKTVDMTFDYLRSAGPHTTFGRAIVTRRGRRVANVRAELWQTDPDKPVALGHGHFLLVPLTTAD